MSDPGPLPEPRRGRRRWLYVALALVGGCLLLCCLFFVWANTLGEDVFDDFATSITERVTEEAE